MEELKAAIREIQRIRISHPPTRKSASQRLSIELPVTEVNFRALISKANALGINHDGKNEEVGMPGASFTASHPNFTLRFVDAKTTGKKHSRVYLFHNTESGLVSRADRYRIVALVKAALKK